MAKKYLAFSPYSDCTPSSWDMPWVVVHTSAEKHSQTVRCVPLVKCRGASALVKYREELPLGSKCLAGITLQNKTLSSVLYPTVEIALTSVRVQQKYRAA